jgi:hypothetical protein
MDPPLSTWRLRHTPLSTLRISGACSLMLATTSELTMADRPSAQSDEMDAVSSDSDRAEPGAADAFPMAHRRYAPFTAKVSLSCCRAATDASFSRLAFQPEPAARSACLTSSSSALQVEGHSEGAQKDATAPWRHLRAMPSGRGYVYLGGLTASMQQIVATETGP